MRSRVVGGRGGDRLLVYGCEGCGRRHAVRVGATDTGPGTGGVWSWNGSVARPTLMPAVRVNTEADPGIGPACHHFVLEGSLQYIAGTTHALAGMNVEIPLLSCSS